MQASPGPPESLAGLATAPGFARRLRLHVAEHRLRKAEQARHRTGCAVRVEADAGEDFHAPAADQRRRACSSSLARPARALAPAVEALRDGMQGRGAATDIALAELAFELERRVTMSGTKHRNTWTISSVHLPTISPRACASSPTSAAVSPARPWRRSCRDDRAGKAPGAPCRSASPHGRHAAARRLRGQPARRWRSWRGSAARRSARRRGFSGSPRDHRHLHVHQHRVERHARLQHLLNARQPAVGEGHQALAAQQLGGDLAVPARCPPLPADARPATAGCLHRARRRVGRGALFAVQRMQHRVGQLAGVTGR